VLDEQHRFDEVLGTLEQERLRVDQDLRRLAAAAVYLGTLLSKLTYHPSKKRSVHGSMNKNRRSASRRCGYSRPPRRGLGNYLGR